MKNNTTILYKEGFLALLSFVKTEYGMGIGHTNQKDGSGFVKQYDNERKMLTDYRNAINISVERGWEVVFKGIPMYG